MRTTLLLLILLSLLVCGCGEKKEPAPPSEAVVRVAIDPDFPPFEFVDSTSGAESGFDVELIREVCSRCGWKVEFLDVPFENLIEGLKRGDWDFAVSAITITAQRQTSAVFSEPYFQCVQTIAVPVSDSTTTGLNDLVGKRVGVLAGSTAEQLVKGIDGVLVYRRHDLTETFEALLAGQLDAVVNDAPSTRLCTGDREDIRLQQVEECSEEYGIAVARGDTARLADINSALQQIKHDGTLAQLRSKWLGGPCLEPTTIDQSRAK